MRTAENEEAKPQTSPAGGLMQIGNPSIDPKLSELVQGMFRNFLGLSGEQAGADALAHAL
jgi:hypothetical protein